ncbi:P-loop containing nucleoside triphosphate hydrolase protein [Biscogniauxia mediterranea]|nr:P-loop containing nucleoside triphosphate hydrolase protein [Biscogniauxia mediterranea]
MQGRSLRGERPSASSRSLASSGTRTGAAARSSIRPPASRTSSLRHQATHHATVAARIDRAAAASPAESMISTATTGTKRKDREFEIEAFEETNINVVVRCRGRNEREQKENSAVVVRTDAAKGKLVELSMGPNALSNKTYNFDRVFSQAADQSMVYEDVVKPILEEMLGGFNCTIFAYGQTGTGKTYTMSGDMNDTFGLLSDEAGIIPRVLHSLFNKLDADETENFVKCSFIELYNEELRDLISSEDNAKLKIYDDTSRKGHNATIVQGMEESHITTAAQGIKLLQDGSLKRQVAATKCNDLSSRSHTVFTITTCIKRTGEDGEDYVSAGKLNLVDLAGSENIQRSGAENKRAAEAGLINKSLLTLGRVINALVDHSPHIPYRESKLTRLLQDSLGGRTKTCIIATISPARSNLEETISTLDYAFRAKNIRNKPQVNQLINKKTLLREFTHEIERLKSELIATRQRNGVYLSNEAYEEMTVESESRRIQNEEQAAKIETLESNLRNKVQELFSLTTSFMGLKKDHEATKSQLDETKGVLDQTELVLEATRKTLAEETHIREAHQKTEEQMHAIGGELINTLQKTVSHVGGLHAKNKRKSDLQMLNRSNWAMAQDEVADVTSLVENRVEQFRNEQQQQISSISERMHLFVQDELQKLSTTQSFLDQNLELFAQSKKELMEQKQKSKDEMDEVLEEIKEVRDNIKERVGDSLQAIATAAERIAQDVLSELSTFHNQLHTSYASLGREFKSIFEDLLKHIASQRQESDELREQLQHAGENLVQSNVSISTQLQQVIQEERKQAAEERRNLLAQITTLINSQADLQESRLANKAASIQQSVQESNTTFEGRLAQYSQGMDSWDEKEDQLVDEIAISRETLKTKLQEDWTTANNHSTSIQGTTKSVHAETIRVVDEQMKDLDEQMTSLDDFVTRAKSQNAQHHNQHSGSLVNLSSTVEESYEKIGDHFKTTCSRVEELGTEMDTDIRITRDALEPLSKNVCQPLANLRQDISNTALQEYKPTGETPQKMAYQYPTELPRTEAREALIAQFNGEPSPCKTPTVYADADPTLQENRSPSRAFSSDHTLPLSDRMSMSLREVHPNINNAGSFNLDARTNSTIHEFSAVMGASVDVVEDHTMPLFKKSRLVRPKATKKAASAEGRENVPLLAAVVPGNGTEIFSQSTSRRKSPRLN